MAHATSGIPIIENSDGWRTHRFGVSDARWASFVGRSYWITGAGTGYGRAIALALASAGANVFLSGRRKAKLLDAIGEIAAIGGNAAGCHAVPVDVTDSSSVAGAAKEIKRKCDSLSGVVNSAALPEPAVGAWPLADVSIEAWNDLFATNVTGQWNVARASLPLFGRGSGIRILFLSSEAGWAFTPGMGPYNVSKAALNNLAASLAAECAARHPGEDIQVNTLVPGEARTEMNQGSDESPFRVVPMTLLLLSQPPGGPNGRFFHRDGHHLSFAYSQPFEKPLVTEDAAPNREQRRGREFQPKTASFLDRLGSRPGKPA